MTGSRSSGEIDAAFRDAEVAEGNESGAPGSPERAEEASTLPEEKVPL